MADTWHRLLQSVQVRRLCLENPSSDTSAQTAGLASSKESTELCPEPPKSQAIDVAKTHQVIKRQKLQYRQDCLSRSCCCQCHHSERASGRFWALDYILMGIFQTCNVEECNAAKYGVSLRLALTQLGIHRSVVIKVHFLSGLGSFSPSFSLQTDCTVPYTSPGFEVIWRCQNGKMEYEDARKRLIHLYQSDPSFRYHVNPAGKSYIEVRLTLRSICGPPFAEYLNRSLYVVHGAGSPPGHSLDFCNCSWATWAWYKAACIPGKQTSPFTHT